MSDELERLARGAVPGPWISTDGCCVFADGYNGIADAFALNKDHPNGETIFCPWPHETCQANAKYIAAASPDVILALLSERSELVAIADAARTLRDGDGVECFPRSDLWNLLDAYFAARIAPSASPPRYEYRTVEGPRKGPTPAPPDGDGWERDPDAGRPGESWDRFDAHEEYYWRRRIAPNQDGEK